MNKKSFLIAGLFIFLSAACSDKNKGVNRPADPRQSGPPDKIKTEEGKPLILAGETKGLAQVIEPQIANPFLTPEEEEYFWKTEKKIEIDYLNLSAVFYSPGNSKVIIGGGIFKKGLFIDNKEITEIGREWVILKDTTAKYILKMKRVLE